MEKTAMCKLAGELREYVKVGQFQPRDSYYPIEVQHPQSPVSQTGLLNRVFNRAGRIVGDTVEPVAEAMRRLFSTNTELAHDAAWRARRKMWDATKNVVNPFGHEIGHVFNQISPLRAALSYGGGFKLPAFDDPVHSFENPFSLTGALSSAGDGFGQRARVRWDDLRDQLGIAPRARVRWDDLRDQLSIAP